MQHEFRERNFHFYKLVITEAFNPGVARTLSKFFLFLKTVQVHVITVRDCKMFPLFYLKNAMLGNTLEVRNALAELYVTEFTESSRCREGMLKAELIYPNTKLLQPWENVFNSWIS